jgi:hypothetical protein
MTGLQTALVMLLLLAAVGSGLVSYRYAQDIAAARAAVSEGAKIATTAVGPLEYGETGSGTPLLSIHGAGGGYDQGLANAADLVGSGFRIIVPSRFKYLGMPVRMGTRLCLTRSRSIRRSSSGSRPGPGPRLPWPVAIRNECRT